MTKEKDNSIEIVVLNYFLRVIKSEGKYMFYRRRVRNNGLIGYLIGNKTPPLDCPFRDAASTNDVVKILKRLTKEMTSKNGKKELDKYEHVTMTINHLLHYFIECYGVGMEVLCSMGEEIYNLSCNKLFGDTLEDLRKQNDEELNNITSPQLLTAKLFNEYVNAIKNGNINRAMTFDEFIKKHNSINSLKNMNVCEILGNAPLQNEPFGDIDDNSWDADEYEWDVIHEDGDLL